MYSPVVISDSVDLRTIGEPARQRWQEDTAAENGLTPGATGKKILALEFWQMADGRWQLISSIASRKEKFSRNISNFGLSRSNVNKFSILC
jgi:hypothetical protein